MRNKKIYAVIILALVIGLFVIVYNIEDNTKNYNEAYYFPNGYKGCTYVIYNVKNAPELRVKDHTIQYKYNKEGIMLTSSPEDFGWEGQESSGLFNASYFYIDDNGKEIELELDKDVFGGGMSSFDNNDGVNMDYVKYAVKKEDVDACSKTEILENLITKYIQ